MRLTILLVTGLVAGSLTAQVRLGATPPAEPAAPVPRPGSVEGKVTNSVTRQPIVRATVYLEDFQHQIAYIATTDAFGEFRFENVTPGNSYAVSAERPGFRVDFPQRASPAFPAVRVADEQHVMGVNVRLTPLGAIAGSVLDTAGQPIPGADVQLLVRGYSNGESMLRSSKLARSDDRGAYRFFDLEPGTYFLRASQRPEPFGVSVRVHNDRPAELYAEAFYPASTGAPGSIELMAGAEVTGIDFHLPRYPAYHIRGKITDAATGKAVAAQVMVLPCQDAALNLTEGFSPRMQPDGVFDSGSLAPGSYCLTARAANPSGARSAPQTVEIKDRDVEGVTISVMPGVEVHGRARFDVARPDSPGGQIQVWLTPASGPPATIKSDNTFSMAGVTPGRYQLHVSNLSGTYLKSVTLGAKDASDGVVDVTASGADIGLLIGTDTGRVDLTVQSPDGSVPQMVFAVPADHSASRQDLFRMGLTAPDGTARIPGLAPGDYDVFAWESAEAELARVPAFLELLRGCATRVTVHPNGHESAQVTLTTVEEIDAAKAKFR